ncbi:MAG: hypothetical protein RL011_1357 [Pseudomonadota bacterium]
MAEGNSQTQTIVRHPREAPEGMRSVNSVFVEAKAQGLRATLILHDDSLEGSQILARRHHDLRAALRTLDLSVKALTSGYRFEDGQAQAKIAAMQRAVQCLQREISLVSDILQVE